ncbi:MAG: hypothetical protein F4X34_05915 [Chloroflexi bacterium]|nr:hypothetical protein [Chloroflexota bacterium]MYE54715.1 hypothetical protein [Chloroflexota bacterium]
MGEVLDFIVFFSAIILGPFYVVVLLFQLFCIVWAPYASSTCAGIARRSRLDANRYGRIGFIYSVMLFVPWLHLKRRMQNRPYSFGTDSFDYTLLYILWLGVIAANAVILLMTVGREGWGIFQVVVVLAALAMGVPAWIISLRALLRRRSMDERPENMQADGLPERVYIMPFVWTSANILALPVMLISGIIIGLLLSPFF